MEEGKSSKKQQHSTHDEDAEILNNFRRSRKSLMCIVADFVTHSYNRVRELRRILTEPNLRSPELLDHKSYNVSTIVSEI